MAAPLVTASLGMAAERGHRHLRHRHHRRHGQFRRLIDRRSAGGFRAGVRHYYFPDFALAFMYLIMVTVLVVRPGGLLGKEA